MRAGRRLWPAGPALVIAGLLALIPFPTCILRLTIGLPCPACGLTRAALALLRLDIGAASRFHPLSAPLAVLVFAAIIVALSASDGVWRRFSVVALGGSAVALQIVWVLRICGVFGELAL
jgi:hypothetical protein